MITRNCIMCNQDISLPVSEDDVAHWLITNALIQDALPQLDASQRELLVSGLCGVCFDRMFPDVDSDDD